MTNLTDFNDYIIVHGKHRALDLINQQITTAIIACKARTVNATAPAVKGVESPEPDRPSPPAYAVGFVPVNAAQVYVA